MKPLQIVEAILMLLGGLGVTLFGMKTMSDSLQTASGDKVSKVFQKISDKRLPGVLIGAGVTGLIQSSGATTIMVVGFVNAGIMTLFQATSIIMGANIGTTITAQIAALSSFNVTPWLALVTFIGITMMMFKKKNVIKNVGIVLVGLGLIFIGLYLMSDSMSRFKSSDSFQKLISGESSPILILLIGLFLTALLQSSSAVSVILITMSTAGLINISLAAYAILGANIGSCITTVLASFGATANAKRATLIHILFNCFGVLVFLPIVYFTKIMDGLLSTFKNPATTIAMFHTIFNISTTIILLPFIDLLCKIANKVIKGKPEKEDPYELKFSYIDTRMLTNTGIAIVQIRQEIVAMADLSKTNLDDAVKSVLDVNIDQKEIFEKREKKINFLNRQLAKVLVQLTGKKLTVKDKKMIGTLYHVISDIERIGDYAENIMEYAEKMINGDIAFSVDAQTDIKEMVSHIETLYSYVIKSFIEESRAYMDIINDEEDRVDYYCQTLDQKHIERLNENKCSPENGAIFLSLISNLERIADHMVNVAISLKDYAKK